MVPVVLEGVVREVEDEEGARREEEDVEEHREFVVDAALEGQVRVEDGERDCFRVSRRDYFFL